MAVTPTPSSRTLPSAPFISAMITVMVMAGLCAVVITAILASTELTVVIGFIVMILTTAIPGMFAIMQGMYNNARITEVSTKVDATQASVLNAHSSIMDTLSSIPPPRRMGNP